MGMRVHRDRGQALPLLLVALAVALIAVAVVARFGSITDEAARARTAADAAALAGVAEGRTAARQLAEANGGVLVDYVDEGSTVEVVVRVGTAAARARAEAQVEWVR
ncbi:MAG: pilus assembly protein TadG-related protein [Acidimicrobiales bacterium]